MRASFLFLFAVSAFAQSFEVASIRPHEFGKATSGRLGLSIEGNRVSALIMTPVNLIAMVYGVENYQVVGFPQWSDDTLNGAYDILATAGEGSTPTREVALGMLAKLLSERFAFQFHEETREFPVFNMVLAKGGAKVVKTKPETAFSSKQSSAPENPRQGVLMNASNETIGQLVRQIRGYVGRPIIDKTGLEGGYDFTLKWLQEAPGGAPATAVAEGGLPTLTTALREQLGLSLEAGKAPFRVIVVDRIERPTDN